MKKLFSIGMIAVLLSVGLQAELSPDVPGYEQYKNCVGIELSDQDVLFFAIRDMVLSDTPIEEVKNTLFSWYAEKPQFFAPQGYPSDLDDILSYVDSNSEFGRLMLEQHKAWQSSGIKATVTDRFELFVCAGSQEVQQYAKQFGQNSYFDAPNGDAFADSDQCKHIKEVVAHLEALGVSFAMSEAQLELGAQYLALELLNDSPTEQQKIERALEELRLTKEMIKA